MFEARAGARVPSLGRKSTPGQIESEERINTSSQRRTGGDGIRHATALAPDIDPEERTTPVEQWAPRELIATGSVVLKRPQDPTAARTKEGLLHSSYGPARKLHVGMRRRRSSNYRVAGRRLANIAPIQWFRVPGVDSKKCQAEVDVDPDQPREQGLLIGKRYGRGAEFTAARASEHVSRCDDYTRSQVGSAHGGYEPADSGIGPR
jgi:hypothetical protein